MRTDTVRGTYVRVVLSSYVRVQERDITHQEPELAACRPLLNSPRLIYQTREFTIRWAGTCTPNYFLVLWRNKLARKKKDATGARLYPLCHALLSLWTP